MKINTSIFIGYLVSLIVIFIGFSPKIAYADGGASAIAIAASFAIKKAEDEKLFDCALHLGANQCRRLDRCQLSLKALNKAKNGNETSLKELNSLIGSSGLVKNCVKSLQGGFYSALIANLEALSQPPVPRGCKSVKIFTTIEGRNCGLEWAGGKGDPVGGNERLAKFDCAGNADPMCIIKTGSISTISTVAEGERCSLEWSEAMGSHTGINDNESLAKFDCDTKGDPLFISGNRISTIIKGQTCFLEWSAAFGGGQVGANEKAAKFDCGSNGDIMDIQ